MSPKQHVTFGPYRLDSDNAQLWRGKRLVRLTRKAFDVLCLLANHPGQLVTKDTLLAAVWPEVVVTETAVTKRIQEVRRALRDNPKAPRYIETVHRQGFRFLETVSAQQAAGSAPHHDAGGQSISPQTPLSTVPIVGRETEMAQLHGWLEQARRGERQLVFVVGEVGIGKTTIVEAFLDSVPQAEMWIGYGQCIEQYGPGEAYLPILEALMRMCRAPSGARVITVLRQHAPHWLVQLPATLRAEERQRLRRETAGTTQPRMLREMAEALEVLAAEKPLLLILEDLQWSDYSSVELLTALARRRERARLLVLGTYRPIDVLVREHPLRKVKQELQVHGDCQELALDFLTVEAVGDYLVRRFGAAMRPGGPEHHLAQVIHARTDGNPLFMVTMVDALVRQGVLRAGATGWECVGEVETAAASLPETLRQLLERHVEQLAAEDQVLLEAASVAGVEFAVAAVAAAVGWSVAEVEERCATLARRGQVLRVCGTDAWPDGTVATRYAFLHTLYRETLYERVPVGRRVRWHQQIGRRLAAGYAPQARERAAELAGHFVRGRMMSQAVPYLRQAGETAMLRSAHREAVGYFEQALSAIPHLPDSRDTREQAIDLRFDLRDALHPLGEHGRILDHLRQAEPLAEALGDRRRLGQLAVYMTACLRLLGDPDGSLAAAQRALALAEILGDVGLQAVANACLGELYLYTLNDYRRGTEAFSRNVEILHGPLLRERFGSALVQSVNSRACLAVCLAELGAFAEGGVHGEEALRLAEAVEHPYSLAQACATVGHFYLRQGDLPQALRVIERGLMLSDTVHLPVTIHRCNVLLGAAYALSGRVPEALPLLERALEQIVTMRATTLYPLYAVWVAEGYVLAGRVAQARPLGQRALEVARAQKQPGYEAYALRLVGEIGGQDEASDVEVAATCYRQALALAEALGMRPLAAHCHRGLGVLYLKTQRQDQARAALTAALDLYHAMDMTFWLPQAEQALAQVEG